MKQYWSIMGPSRAPQLPCVAFYKYDGSNFRAEWTKKQGWCKFGTRRTMIDGERDKKWGNMVTVFLKKYAEDLSKLFTDHKHFKGAKLVTIFGEYYGPNSFAGLHDEKDEMTVTLIDACVHKKGIILPNDFVKLFGHLHIPEIIYEGNFNRQLIIDVKNNKYDLNEGIVAKGTNVKNKKNPQHGLWMSKVKTSDWMRRLHTEAQTNEFLNKVLTDNEREQV